jgi:hypothetical protein
MAGYGFFVYLSGIGLIGVGNYNKILYFAANNEEK